MYSDRSVTFNTQNSYSDRGRGGRGGGGYRGNHRDNYNSDYGAAAYSQGDDMRKYGNKKPQYKKNRGVYRPPRGGAGPRAHLDDDGDDSMADNNEPGPSHGRRFNPYGGGRSRGRGNRGRHPLDRDGNNGTSQRYDRGYGGGSRGRGGQYSFNNRPTTKFIGGPHAWFRVAIPYGKNYDKDWLLSSLLNQTSVPFVPKEFQYEGNQAKFMIQDAAAATALMECTKRVTAENGRKIIVIVNTSRPTTAISPDDLEKLKVVMSTRYDPSTKTMNLSALDKDQALLGEDIRLTLTKLAVAREVLKIINENIPELESLDIQKNSLCNLSVLASLHTQAPNLTKLNLGHNMIRHISELESLTRIPLVELCLDGNPLCDHFPNETTYVSAVRKKFPKVLKLDGHDLPPPITFDVESTTKVPESQGSFFGSNDHIKGLVIQFVQQYLGLHDSSDRQGLLEAYHEQAVFSMTTYKNNAMQYDQPHFSDYLSRNISRVHDTATRTKLLKCGRLSIVAHLSDLPATEHDMTSLLLDIIHMSSSMLVFSVQGVFREGTSDTPENRRPVRTFSRLFVTIPLGAGISILNEELSITNATNATKKKSFKAPEPQSPAGPSVVSPAASPAASPVAAASLTLENKTRLTQLFSKESSMNMGWSAKCLEENNWNYDMSAKMFVGLKATGGIPPEAFLPDP